jgi:hypothetical protein
VDHVRIDGVGLSEVEFSPCARQPFSLLAILLIAVAMITSEHEQRCHADIVPAIDFGQFTFLFRTSPVCTSEANTPASNQFIDARAVKRKLAAPADTE